MGKLTESSIGVRHADHILIDQIGYFPVERCRKAVCHMSADFLANIRVPTQKAFAMDRVTFKEPSSFLSPVV